MSGSVNKVCERCGNPFGKRFRDSGKQWQQRRFCSAKCSNLTTAEKRFMPAAERFWEKAITREWGCWSWSGVKDQYGYGRVGGSQQEPPKKAHRISWEIHFGNIPDGLHVLHACDTPECTNPKHLMLGTQQANMIDCGRKGRVHPNSLRNLNNERQCK